MEVYELLVLMFLLLFCELALELVEHLRAMGETNALFQRNPVSVKYHTRLSGNGEIVIVLVTLVIELELVLYQVLKRDTALATAAIYQSMFGLEDGSIPATFQVQYLSFGIQHIKPYLYFCIKNFTFI